MVEVATSRANAHACSLYACVAILAPVLVPEPDRNSKPHPPTPSLRTGRACELVPLGRQLAVVAASDLGRLTFTDHILFICSCRWLWNASHEANVVTVLR